MQRSILFGFAAIVVLIASSGTVAAADRQPAALPGTRLLDWTDDLSVRIVDEAHQFLDRKTAESVHARQKLWKRDFSSPAEYEKSIEPNRQSFRKVIGVVDPRLPAAMERFGDDANPALVAETSRYRVFQVRWPVLEGVFGEGLLLEPVARPAAAHVVVLPDADQTPEQLVGLAPGVAAESQLARRLAENGVRVVVPVLLSRACDFSGNPQIAMTNQPHREWIYRQAFEVGRHVIGYEVQRVLAVVDWFQQTAGAEARIGVAGWGEGGLVAFYAAAADRRIGSCLVSGYFGPREQVWQEPIYRNVWNLLREFGDAELASLVAPRALTVEYSQAPSVDGPPKPAKGRRGGAAPGRLTTPPYEAVQQESRRAAALVKLPTGWQPKLVSDNGAPVAPGSQPAVLSLLEKLGVTGPAGLSSELPQDARKNADPQARQKRQIEQLTEHVRMTDRQGERIREQWFLEAIRPKTADDLAQGAQKYRQIFRDEVIGSFDDPLLAPAPRSRKIYDEPQWTGYDVVLDVFPELHVWGVLCLPKDIKPGERRPVVVCQHGLEGVPRDTIEKDIRGFRYYKAFTAELANRGFITFAPYNLYRGQDRFRTLQRKLNPLRASLFTLIGRQHEQLLGWLASLPYVDRSRIGFYGLSYGGKSAMRLPALLEGYALSICSGDFNDWVRKNFSIDFNASYMFTGEWEIFEWDLGHTFNYAEMAFLIFPRPFMVERGHHDGVAIDPWVAYEYAKVQHVYDELKLGDRTEIEYFNGPHEINGQRSYEFLHKHLAWPKR